LNKNSAIQKITTAYNPQWTLTQANASALKIQTAPMGRSATVQKHARAAVARQALRQTATMPLAAQLMLAMKEQTCAIIRRIMGLARTD